MIMLDNTVVNVALPTIQDDLNLKTSELEWIVTGYALTFGAFMLTGGKLADLLGRRRIFVIGLVIFTASSLACGLANGAEVLIARPRRPGHRRRPDESRDPVDHRRDVPGAPARHRDRRLGRRLRPRARDRPPRRRDDRRAAQLELDLLHQRPDRHARDRRGVSADRRVARHLAGAAARLPRPRHLDIGLFALTLRPDRGEHVRLDVDADLVAFGIAIVSLVAFLLLEHYQRLPMLELGLFRNKRFAGANTVMLLVGLAMFGVFFYVSLYIQTCSATRRSRPARRSCPGRF